LSRTNFKRVAGILNQAKIPTNDCLKNFIKRLYVESVGKRLKQSVDITIYWGHKKPTGVIAC
jgi:hypothetical protein